MNRVEAILDHILLDCEDTQAFIADMTEEAFQKNRMVQNAVGLSILNIGEMVKALPIEFRDAYPAIPWRSIAGMRDLVAHKYHTMDMTAVWNVAKYRIPEIIVFIQEYKSAARQ